MRCAIIADIHANLAAFAAVLDDIKAGGGVDKFWCLGDIVGYGPDPHECIETLRRLDHICVAGNHDLAAIGKIGAEEFNLEAAAAVEWTSKQLNATDVAYLEKLPAIIEEGGFTIVHGSPMDPVWEYILSTSQAKENFAHFKTRFCLVGHSHVPLVFTENRKGEYTGNHFLDKIELGVNQSRFIINPGGVGQPRDGDPHASYAIYDSVRKAVSLHRVPYDIEATQAKMEKQGLPESLIRRLSYGR